MTLALQYERSARVVFVHKGQRVTVNETPQLPGQGIVHLRVGFSVVKDIGPDPNTATIEVVNLAQTTRDLAAQTIVRPFDLRGTLALALTDFAKFAKQPLQYGPDTVTGTPLLSLEAGHDGRLSQLITGTATHVKSRHESEEWTTTFEVAESPVQVASAWMNKSYAPGWTAYSILDDASAAMGLRFEASPQATALLTTFTFAAGFAVWGRAYVAMAEILAAAGLDDGGMVWWIDDGVMRVVLGRESLAAPPVMLTGNATLASEGGFTQLLRKPERMESDTVGVECLLSPSIRPGFACTIVGSEFSGTYRCEKVEHTGDNMGGPFATTAILAKQSAV